MFLYQIQSSLPLRLSSMEPEGRSVWLQEMRPRQGVTAIVLVLTAGIIPGEPQILFRSSSYMYGTTCTSSKRGGQVLIYFQCIYFANPIVPTSATREQEALEATVKTL
jgi:hypothetical protein